ncbi:MAG: ATPase [Proteobacteria bacterium]|nr:ATPase [Pseudomonadota bacterium]MDA1355064.1 ATPase [Pseudomonadota bacterium]
MKKRFYKNAAVEKLDDGFTVALDGRSIKTPAKLPLVISIEELAEAVAAEWRAQNGEIRHETMPMMRFVCTALDRVTPSRAAVILETIKFAETDLLCYRAAQPEELARRQLEHWQPLLDWAETHYGAGLNTTTGLTPIAQDEASLARLRAAVEAESDLTLTGLHVATAASGSLVVALALLEREIDSQHAWATSHIDERWQLERWGEDEELFERLEGLRREISAAGEFLALSRS